MPSAALPLEPPPVSSPPKGAISIIFLVVLIDLLGFGIIIPLLPQLVPDYEHQALKVTLLFSVYSICQFVGAPVLGLMSDRYGRKPVLALSQLGSAAGYVLLGVATYFPPHTLLILVYLSRVIDGFTGGNVSTAQAYIGDVTSRETRAKAMGALGAAFGVGFTLGPAIGGILGHVRTDLPAYLAAALSLLAAILCAIRLPEAPRRSPTEADAWLHPRRFVPILRKPVLVQFLALSFFIMAAFVMMESTVVLFLKVHFHYETLGSGLFFAFIGLVIIGVQGGLIGRLVKKRGEWPLAVAGPLVVALGMLLFSATAFWPLLPVLLLAGAANATGRSLQQPTSSALISKLSEPGEQGAVFGLYHGLGSLARVAGPIAAGLVYPFARNAGPFLLSAAIALAVGAWTLSLSRRGNKVFANPTAAPVSSAATPEPT